VLASLARSHAASLVLDLTLLLHRSTPGENCVHRVGERHEPDEYWLRRFGAMRTVWAGTRNHPFTNFTCLTTIFAFFDEKGAALETEGEFN
jgi:hypothetical protein